MDQLLEFRGKYSVCGSYQSPIYRNGLLVVDHYEHIIVLTLLVKHTFYPFYVYRSKAPFYAVAGAGLFSLTIWGLSLYGAIDPWLGTSRLMSVFVIGFILPLTGYACYLARHRAPVVSIYADYIELRNIIFPSRTLILRRCEIDSIQTNWQPNTTRSDLVFTLSKDITDINKLNARLWRKKSKYDQTRYFDFSHAQLRPDQVVQLLNGWKATINQTE